MTADEEIYVLVGSRDCLAIEWDLVSVEKKEVIDLFQFRTYQGEQSMVGDVPGRIISRHSCGYRSGSDKCFPRYEDRHGQLRLEYGNG